MTAAGWIALLGAAAAGALLRHLVGQVVGSRAGTLAVNLSGSLLAGLVTGKGVVLATGFCGAFTTFSTFTVDTVGLLEQGDLRGAFGNVARTLVLCAAAAAAGLALA